MHPLIDAVELAKLLADDATVPTLLDVRWSLAGPPGRAEYEAGHLPGAVFVDLDRDLAAPPGPAGRHPLPEAVDFQAAMRRAGVSEHRPVVVYDAGNSQAAARAWWNLRYFGHGDVRVLDGGFGAWVAAGGEVSTDEREAEPGDFTARAGQLPVLDADGAAHLASTGILLDARAAERYRGEVEPVDPVAGHIPGAVSAPTAATTDDRGRFLAPDRLREHFAALGVASGGEVGTYCGSGVTAAHQVLALTLAGVSTPALYVGSWSNWVADPSVRSRPAEAPQPGRSCETVVVDAAKTSQDPGVRGGSGAGSSDHLRARPSQGCGSSRRRSGPAAARSPRPARTGSGRRRPCRSARARTAR